VAGYYIDDDGDPIEYDDTPDDDSEEERYPEFWTGPKSPAWACSCDDAVRVAGDCSC
jgi:hypothetical protein